MSEQMSISASFHESLGRSRRLTTLGEKSKQPLHWSFFRESLRQRSRAVRPDQDPVHEYLIDQANLRGFFGAYSNRDNWGEKDPELSLEQIVVGLLQPHAPAEPRIFKLVLRILQAEQIDPDRLLFLAKRERSLSILAWFVQLIPKQEHTGSLPELATKLAAFPPREHRQPNIRYDSNRLLKRKYCQL